jgi:hypothetical protein
LECRCAIGVAPVHACAGLVRKHDAEHEQCGRTPCRGRRSPPCAAADHALVPRGLLSALPDEQSLAMRRLPSQPPAPSCAAPPVPARAAAMNCPNRKCLKGCSRKRRDNRALGLPIRSRYHKCALGADLRNGARRATGRGRWDVPRAFSGLALPGCRH